MVNIHPYMCNATAHAHTHTPNTEQRATHVRKSRHVSLVSKDSQIVTLPARKEKSKSRSKTKTKTTKKETATAKKKKKTRRRKKPTATEDVVGPKPE